MRQFYIGIDNGVSGSIGILGGPLGPRFFRTPVFKDRSYTKDEKHISRVDVKALRDIVQGFPADTLVLLERPMVNPQRFAASMSAMRALEATLIVLEACDYFIRYVDSKEWQSVQLPKIVGADELKAASLKLGGELYPELKPKFKSDADSLLMARWAWDSKL